MKITVLSMNISSYEIIHPVKVKTPDTRYVMVTDDPSLKDESNTWEIVYDASLSGSTFDRCWQVRWAKCWEYAGDCDVLIKIDGSVGIEGDLTPVIESFIRSDAQMGIMLHPTRLKLYDEYVAWVQTRGYEISQAEKALGKLASAFGYPVQQDMGMAQMCFTIEKPTDNVKNLERMMYAMCWYFGESDVDRLDQTIFTAVVLRYFPGLPLWFTDQRLYQSKYFQWYPHHSEIPFKPMDVKQMAKATWAGKRIMTNTKELL